jgi:hypothetical protein
MSNKAQQLLNPDRLYNSSEIGSRPSPVPASAGVYAFYFNEPPPGIDAKDCHPFMPVSQHFFALGVSKKIKSLKCLVPKTVFGQVFGAGGKTNFWKSKSPPRGSHRETE